jgi:uncharacterized protein (DUF433 family)
MSKDDGGVVAAFTEEQVEKLTGVNKRQLQHWDRTDFFVPSMAFQDRRAPYSRLYSFRDLVSLKVLNALRNEANVPLTHLREVKETLTHLGDDLWAKTTLYVLNKHVIFQGPDGDGREEVVTGQAILSIPLLVVANGIEDAVKAMRQRDSRLIGKIEKQKNIARNIPVLAGTRIPVQSVKAFANAGYSVEEIRKEYPTLTEDDIKAAINYGEAA